MNHIKIYPSILAADFACLSKEIKRVEKAGADGIHLDIMDGNFVPNISFGPPVIKSIRKITKLPFWAHLMIQHPEKYIKDYKNVGVQGIVFHTEIDFDNRKLASAIHKEGMEAGISINPETDVEDIFDCITSIERVLIMTVHPGFGGQSFISETANKIPVVKSKAEELDHTIEIEIDGGVNKNNAGEIVKKGANILVAGSSIFKTDNYMQALNDIKRNAEKQL
ncbi:MAG: ribulose-phosphate 3-epimerase [bacterium]